MVDFWFISVPTFYENWPIRLRSLSVATIMRRLSPDEMRAMGAAIMEFGPDFGERSPEVECELKRWLDDSIKSFPHGAFVRLGQFSPKDSWLGHREGFRCESGKRAWELLTDASERMADALSFGLSKGYRQSLLVREWKNIEPWQEFRCFVKDGKLRGISQYMYLKRAVFPELVGSIDSIQWAIEHFFSTALLEELHLSDVVVDVYIQLRKRGNETEIQVKLLELNPWFAYTDPCLFDWNRDKFLQIECRINTLERLEKTP